MIDNNSDITFVGARLVLTSTPGLKLYFKGEGQFEVDGEDVPTSIENRYTVISINDITDIYHMFSVTCDGFALNYSIASYGKQALSGNNESLKNLINAMVAYYDLFKK